MIVFYDENGRYTGHAIEGYPAPAETLANMRQAGGRLVDTPPFPGPDWYFPNGVPTIRPTISVAVSATKVAVGDRLRFDGIPAGTTVYVTGAVGGTIVADDDPLEISFDLPGVYTIGFEAWPARAESISVQVEG